MRYSLVFLKHLIVISRIVKLDAYGFDTNDLKLEKRKKRVKRNDKYSSWSEILFGVP